MNPRLVACVQAVLLLAAIAAGWALATGRIAVPPQWNPWAPLTPIETPGLFTRYKLDRLAQEPAACRAWLTRAGMRHTPLPDRPTAGGCGWDNASRVESLGSTAFSTPFTLACPAAAALVLWERHALQPAAERHLGSRVAAIEHLGSYACRNVNGQADGPRSEHATANAVDISAFRLADGRRLSVARDWQAARPEDDGPLPQDGLFLRDAHQGACRFFSGVLGPDYNAEHHNHFHLDRGPYRVCR